MLKWCPAAGPAQRLGTKKPRRAGFFQYRSNAILAVTNVHSDFETETHIVVSRCSPHGDFPQLFVCTIHILLLLDNFQYGILLE